MDREPKLRPKLPVVAPAGRPWQVRLERVHGRFAIGQWQRGSGGFVFPSHIVERALGCASATTRWWETIERVAAIVRQ